MTRDMGTVMEYDYNRMKWRERFLCGRIKVYCVRV